MPDAFAALGETLLRAGIAPAQIRRYLAELRDHADDLAEQFERDGASPDDARRRALQYLGDNDALALPLLVQPRFRSWAARLPGLCFLALPLLSQLLASALLILVLIGAATALDRPHLLPDLGSMIAIAWLILPVATAWLVLPAAHRRRARLHYPLLGLLAGAALAVSLQLHIALPTAEAAGAISVALQRPAPLPLLVLLTLGLLPLAILRLRDAPL